MPRVGKIAKVHDGLAMIRFKANEACEGCEACGHGADDSEKELEAINNLGAEVGDTVEFDMEVPSLLSAAFIAYTIPMLVMLGTILISFFIFRSMGTVEHGDLYSIAIGFVALFLTYMVIRKFDPKFKASKRYFAVITRIVIKEDQEVF